MEDEQQSFSIEEHLTMGADHWNKWAEKQALRELDLTDRHISASSFENYVFPSKTKIFKTSFQNEATFKKSEFKKEVAIGNPHQDQTILFDDCKFEETVSISRDDKGKHIEFQNSEFNDGITAINRHQEGPTVKLDKCRIVGTTTFESSYIWDLQLFRCNFESHPRKAPAEYRDLSFRSAKFHYSDHFFTYCYFNNYNIHFENSTLRGIYHFENASFKNSKLLMKNCNGSAIFDFEKSTIEEFQIEIRACTNLQKLQIGLSRLIGKKLVIRISHCVIDHLMLSLGQCKFEIAQIIIDTSKISKIDADFKYFSTSEGYVSFTNTEFLSGNINFQNAVFGNQRSAFDKSTFTENTKTDFSYSHFKGPVTFIGAKISSNSPVPFRGASFAGGLDLNQIETNTHFDLDQTDIKQHFRLNGDEFPLPVYFLKKTPREIGLHFKRLKEIAAANKDHNLEIEFFAKELVAQGSKIGALYGFFSNYGRSTVIPFAWLFCTILWCSNLYFFHATSTNASWWNALNFSIAHAVAFSGTSKAIAESSSKALYYSNPPDFVQITSACESVLCTIFIFLLILAVRNRFRI